jgi:hypothetical protein
VCLDAASLRECLPNQTPLTTRPTCHGNICVATDGDEVYLGHETTVYISQRREKYVAFDTIPTTPGGVIVKLNVSRPMGITIIGPGVVQANLPLLLGKNVTVSNNVEFRQCNGTGRAQAALLLQEGGDVLVEGTVGYHYAKSFVTVAPASPLGESVELSDSSTIVYTGRDRRVCAAAFSRVEGKVAVHCNDTCFTVSQDLEGKDRLVLSEDANVTTNVNLTSLLNDFGSEYLVQYVDGPSNGDSTPTAVAGILSSLTLTVLIVTVISQQRYFKFI